MRQLTETPISELHDPALERLVRIYYFLRDGEKYRNAQVLSRRDYADMQGLLEEGFPGQFRKQDVTFYTERKLSRTFNNVYLFYNAKYGFLLGKNKREA